MMMSNDHQVNANNDNAGFWVDLLTNGSLTDLKCHFFGEPKEEVPINLLHLACQILVPSSENAIQMIPFLVEHLPHQLTARDHQKKIPLHYVLTAYTRGQSLASLSMLHCLLQAAPDTILVRLSDNDDDNIDDDDGMLPALLAHHQGAPPTIVQYLLRRQIMADNGLVLAHKDLSCLLWNEESFWQHVAAALHQVVSSGSGDVVHRICFQDIQLSYSSWQLLQHALGALSPGNLKQLSLRQLHIWHATSATTRTDIPTANNDNPTQPEQQMFLQVDEHFWRKMVELHKETLVQLELPQFYALTNRSVQLMADFLERNEFPNLQVLDARTSPVNARQESPQSQQSSALVVERLVKALKDTSCRLKSLSLSILTSTELKLLLQEGLTYNRSLEYFEVETVLQCSNTNTASNVTSALRQALCRMLQYNTTLERFVAPRSLIHCAKIQLYLSLNREYHRKDMGHWSPTLVAHVLAKAKQELWKNRSTNNDSGDDELDYFATQEEPQDPRSAMFYILQSRPDIILGGSSTQGTPTDNAAAGGGNTSDVMSKQ